MHPPSPTVVIRLKSDVCVSVAATAERRARGALLGFGREPGARPAERALFCASVPPPASVVAIPGRNAGAIVAGHPDPHPGTDACSTAVAEGWSAAACTAAVVLAGATGLFNAVALYAGIGLFGTAQLARGGHDFKSERLVRGNSRQAVSPSLSPPVACHVIV